MSLDLVPQFFYDLIARVIPGAGVIFAWYLTILGPTRAFQEMSGILSNQNSISFWVFACLLILAYILGFMLQELWSLTFGKIKSRIMGYQHREIFGSCLSELNKIRKRHGKSEIEFTEDEIPLPYTMYDHLHHYLPSEAYRLLKVQAEVRLSEGLFIGVVLLPVLNIFLWIRESDVYFLERTIIEVILIVALLVFWRNSVKYEKFYLNGVCKSWLFSNFPVDKAGQKKKIDD